MESNTFNAKDYRSGQKQTWMNEENIFLRQTTSPHLYSESNSRNESLIEYKQEMMGNYYGCHVDVVGRKFGKNCSHGKSIPFLDVRFKFRH